MFDSKRIPHILRLFLSGLILLILPLQAPIAAASTSALTFQSTIEYKETLTRIIHEDNVRGWAPESNLTFSEITSSSDGSRIAFVVDSSYPDVGQHLYISNADGSGITDITFSLPASVESVGTIQLNGNGSRLFFEGSLGDTDHSDFYYYDALSGTCVTAATDITDVCNSKRYDINDQGTRLYFRHNAGRDPVTEEYHRGLFYADIGAEPVQVLDWTGLPCEGSCQTTRWYNNLYFLGVSGDGSTLWFTWNPTGKSGDESMWYVGLDGVPVKMPDNSRRYIWDTGWNKPQMASYNGGQALYIAKNSGEPEEVYSVDRSSGKMTLLGFGGTLDATISSDGTLARISGISHNRGETMVNLRTGDRRDTLSSHMPASKVMYCTRISFDNRYYFRTTRPESGIDDWQYNRIHRIDMAPTDFSLTPDVLDISFSAPALVNDESTTITVYATVSDAQGLDTIEWVKLQSLIDGVEGPHLDPEHSDKSAKEPIRYSDTLYDDGTHGDEVAGDGIFSRDGIKTDADSPFFDIYSLPDEIGIRIVAKDINDNYCVADTTLKVIPESMATGISISEDSLDFGNTTEVGEVSPVQTLTVSNTGSNDIYIDSLALSGSENEAFSIQKEDCSGRVIQAASTSGIDIIFSPVSTRETSATLSIVTWGPGGPALEVILKGQGREATGPAQTTPAQSQDENAELPEKPETIVSDSAGLSLSPASVTATPGDRIRVPIMLEGETQQGTLSFEISCDPALLRIVTVTEGSVPSQDSLTQKFHDSSSLQCEVNLPAKENIQGSLVYVDLDAIGKPPARSHISLNDALHRNVKEETVPVSVTAGLIRITPERLLGDYNNDDMITELDALAARKMANGTLPEDLILDMNNDGIINDDDARSLLARSVQARTLLSDEQEQLISDFGRPDSFTIMDIDNSDGQPVRYETWTYYDGGITYVFAGGVFQTWQEAASPGGYVVPAPYRPGEFVMGASLDELQCLAAGKEWIPLETNDFFLEGIADDLEMYVNQQAIAGFYEGRLCYVEGMAIEPEGGN